MRIVRNIVAACAKQDFIKTKQVNQSARNVRMVTSQKEIAPGIIQSVIFVALK